MPGKDDLRPEPGSDLIGFGLAIVGGAKQNLHPRLQEDRLAALRASDGGGNEGF